MLMKVFNKGQVVIPAEIRQGLGIAPGDFVDVTLDLSHQRIVMRPYRKDTVSSIAGSLSKYKKRKSFPSKHEMMQVLKKGLINE